MKRFFISYSRKDSLDLAFKLAEALNQPKHNPPLECWFDKEDLHAGDRQSWVTRIDEAISACDHFILLMSQDVKRDSSYCINEIVLAKELKKQIFIVQCDDTLPPGIIISLQRISFVGRGTKDDDIDWLVEQICDVIEIDYPPPHGQRILAKRANEEQRRKLAALKAKQDREAQEKELYKSDRARRNAINEQIYLSQPAARRQFEIKRWLLIALGGLAALTVAGVAVTLLVVNPLRAKYGLIPCTDYPDVKTRFGGGRIAFVSQRDGNSNIYAMDADGTNQRQLTDDPKSDYTPVWSPDGSQLVFGTDRDGNEEIYIMNADGSNQRNLTQNSAGDYTPSWSPDGKSIVFASDRGSVSGRNLFIMPVSGGAAMKITGSDFLIVGTPDWSPDGSHIVFAGKRQGFAYLELFTVVSDGSDVRQLTTLSPDDLARPEWSPDGQHISMQLHFAGDSDTKASSINVIQADGSQRRVVFDGIGPATWSPNGQYVAFRSYDLFDNRLLAVSLQESFVCVISDKKDEFGVNWSSVQ